MSFSRRIFDLIDSDRTLVFPNQTSADSWASEYARRNPSKAVFTDKLLSWDRFRDMCRDIPQGLEEASAVHRLVFITSYLKNNRLDILCPAGYPESRANFADEVARSLPELPFTLDCSSSDSRLTGDIRKVLDAYREYLTQNSLYEKSYIKPDFSKAPSNSVLIFADAVRDESIKTAIESGLFEVFETTVEDEGQGITVFDNSLLEIRHAVSEITDLLNSGVPAREIRITLTDGKMIPWLATETRRRGIKTATVKGRSLSDFSCGRLFFAINNVISGRWSLESVRDLVLNPSFPFADRQAFERLVAKAVDAKVVPGYGASSWFAKLGKDETLARLYERINSISNAGSFDELRQAVHGFEDELLGEDPWNRNGDTTQSNAYSRIMKALESLAGAFTPDRTDSAFSMFLRLISCVTYTPVVPTDCIPVYMYPSDAGMTAGHHFALGFDDEAVATQRNMPPFVQEEGQSVTDGILRAYLASGAVISCSRKTYGGVRTVPSFFERTGRVRNAGSDGQYIFTTEEKAWLGITPRVKPTQLQKSWFESAQSTTLRNRGPLEFERPQEPLRITATRLGEFVKCPYRWYCRFVLGIDKTDYEADMTDNRSVGGLLHKCLEEWLKEVGDLDRLATPHSRRVLENIFNSQLMRYSAKPDAAYIPRQVRIGLYHPDILFKFADMPGNSLPEGLTAQSSFFEREFSYEGLGYTVEGRMDCVLKTRDGEYVLLDFKKKSVDKTSLQLHLYARGLDTLPVMGAFYSIEDGRIDRIWGSREELEEQLKNLDAELERMRTAYKTCSFEPSPSDKNCTGCDYRSVCRMRYVVK